MRRFFFLLLLTVGLAAQTAVPPGQLKPQGYVNDFARVLPADQAQQLEQAATALDQQLKVQVAMVTVETTGATDVFDYSLALARQWGVGSKQAANHQKLKVPLLLPGITVSTSPTDYYPVQTVQLARFKGETWDLFGDIMAAEST
mgnify:CR=1 FL=1